MDIINALFEGASGLLLWVNVVRLLRDKRVSGVSVIPVLVFTLWGFWNLLYYPHLGHWFSAFAGVLVVAANSTWVVLALYYRKRVG